MAKRIVAGGRRRGGLATRLRVEQLEQRLTPTGNLTITNALLVDGNDHPLSNISAGEQVYVEADFTTQNLPSNASYRVGYTVNGFTLDTGNLTWGAGASGTGAWYAYWGYFVATAGLNRVTVTLDPDQSVAETSYTDNTLTFTFTAASTQVGNPTYSVAQMRAAYGVNSIPNFGSATADGTGQTIAIVDAFNDPNIISDLDGFDKGMNLNLSSSQTLYQQYGPASSILSVYNQSGTNITGSIAKSGTGGVPPVDPSGGWEGEETLDVEWAHAMAPGAHIDLIETNGSGSFLGLFAGAATAAQLPGVTAVSMSWIWSESNWGNGSAEAGYDSGTFVTPSGHAGVTFLAASGDGGVPGGYPAYSPNVVAVGGTELTVNGNTYGSEIGWSFPTPRTLNDGSGSYSQTGAWTAISGGFSGTYGTAAAGSSASATWTTSLSSSDQGWVGGTEVSATWVAAAGNATNATYRVYDGTAATGTLVGTVTVDQTKSPAGTADGNTAFQELGDYFPSSGTLTVVLNANSANGTVVADAVGIAPGWATGGGQSQYESEPAYQLSRQSTGRRTIPDVSSDGSLNSGVTCFQNGGWGYGYFGTSLACPCWAGLIAIADQGRVANGLPSLDGGSQTLPALYALPASDFHDVTGGYNGLFAGAGYDLLTGLGSPRAQLLIGGLVTYGTTAPAVTTQPSDHAATAGQSVTFTAAASGYPAPTVQWQVSTDGGVTFINIAGATGASYTFTATLSQNTDQFRAVFTNVAGSVMTTAAHLTVSGPVTVAAVQVNDGSLQRSEVRSITVTFSGPVTFAGGDANAAAAFQLLHIQTGANVILSAAVSTDGQGRTVVTLTFSGSETDPVSALNGGALSLADGRYTLTVLGGSVSDANGAALDGDSDGTPGGNYVSPPDTYLGNGLHLYRLFGDANGDGVVDATDVGQLKSTFNRNTTDPLYLSFLDADNSGSVDAQDVGQFKLRFNTNVFG